VKRETEARKLRLALRQCMAKSESLRQAQESTAAQLWQAHETLATVRAEFRHTLDRADEIEQGADEIEQELSAQLAAARRQLREAQAQLNAVPVRLLWLAGAWRDFRGRWRTLIGRRMMPP